MFKTDLLEIIANGENSGVEFKRDDVRPEQLAKKLETYFIILIEKQILAQQRLYPYFATFQISIGRSSHRQAERILENVA